MFTFEKKEVHRLFSGKSIPIKDRSFSKVMVALKAFIFAVMIFGIIGFSFASYYLNTIQTSIVEASSSDGDAKKAAFGIDSLADTLTQLKNLVFSNSVESIVSSEDGWTNILLLGLPSKDFPGQMLTDSILVVSINIDEEKSIITSIPRDLAVELDGGKTVKVNSVYARYKGGVEGTTALSKEVNEITGLNIDYYIRLDFVGFEKFIDTLDGIDVNVKEDIYDPQYPTPNYGTELFEISKGEQHLDGKTALKYVRTRHTSENDFGRSKRQQQVINTIVQDFREEGDLFNFGFNKELIKLVKGHVKTNISLSEVKAFYSLSEEIDLDNIESIVIDNRNSGLLTSGSNGLGYYLEPRGNEGFNWIHKYIKERM